MPKPSTPQPKHNRAQRGARAIDIAAAHTRAAQNADNAVADPRADQPVTDATEPGYCATVAANFLVDIEPPAAAGATATKKHRTQKS